MRAPRVFYCACRSRRSGIVLVLVLIVVMIIALAGFSFVELMLTENKATHLHTDELRLQHALGSGVEYLKLHLEQPPIAQSQTGGTLDNPTAFRAVSLAADDRRSNTPRHDACFSIVTGNGTFGPEGGIRFGVENESGRLHLAAILRWEEQQPGSGRTALLKFPGMTEATADAILDWIDADSEPRAMGAESDYYAGIEPAYVPRNGLPDCLEELLLVKGVTRELLFGADANYNYQLDPEELAPSRGGTRAAVPSVEAVPWATLLTLYSGQRNVTADGQPRIDLNEMNLTTLEQQLGAAVDANWAAFIVAYRQFGPYGGSTAALPGPPQVTPSAPPKFTISSVLDLAGAKVAIPGSNPQQPPKIHASPLAADPGAMAQHLPKLMEKTTVVNLPVIRGCVSVNHAPRAVLRVVPGVDDSLADRILAARDAQSSGSDSQRTHATWLLTEGLVDLETMKKLMPNVCAGGDVVRAQIVAHFSDKGPTARAEVVIDATSRPARQIYWRDLRFWGAGYPREWFAADSGFAQRRN
jgi:DNA uptake protein ComE-like DNA-binding protein